MGIVGDIVDMVGDVVGIVGDVGGIVGDVGGKVGAGSFEIGDEGRKHSGHKTIPPKIKKTAENHLNYTFFLKI